MTTHSPVNQSSENHYLNCHLCSLTRLLTCSGHTAGSRALVKQSGYADVIHSSLKKQVGSKPPGKWVKGRQTRPPCVSQVIVRFKILIFGNHEVFQNPHHKNIVLLNLHHHKQVIF